MSIKIEMLRCFVIVAEQGNLSRAAEVLGRTPSAVSMMLKQFEAHIGAPLFETGRKGRLSDLGAHIFEEAQRGVAHFEKTVSAIEALSRTGGSRLRLAVTPSIASTILPQVIRRFAGEFPDVMIEIRDMDSAAIARALMDERADIGMGSLPQMVGMERTSLFSDSYGVVCRHDHPIVADWGRTTWKTMGDHALITNGLCGQITDPDFADIRARSQLSVPNLASLLGLLREGVGITVLPRLAVVTDRKGLVFLPLTDLAARREVYMVTRPLELGMPAMRAFHEMTLDMVPEARAKLAQDFRRS